MSVKGIQIVVDLKAPLLPILLRYRRLSLKPFLAHGEVLRIIEIPEGEEAGLLWVKFPGVDWFIKIFGEPENIYMIQDLSGETLVKNWHLCLKCWKLTGKEIQREASKKAVVCEDVTFECDRCKYTWEVTI